MIYPHLTHRCTIRRREEIVVDGASSWVWQDIATGVPCLWSAERSSEDATFWGTTTDVASGMQGRLFVGPRTDIRKADVITITRPSGGPSLTVTHSAPDFYDHHKKDHKAFVVKENRAPGL